MEFLGIIRCVEPDCRCDDRAGVIVYRGPDAEEALRVADEALPHGNEYWSEVELVASE